MMKTCGWTGVRRIAAPMVVAVVGWMTLACGGPGGPGAADSPDPTDGEASSSGDHEPESSCAAPPACGVEALCEATQCGGKTAAINHFGCTRPSCDSDADCPSAERCYPRAMGASCLSSSVDCESTEEGCVCGSTNDCNGVLTAHCLPAEFYPIEGYCDPAVFSCEELGAWHDALRAALDHHDQAGRAELSERLSSCSASVVDTRLACGHTACAIACQISVCPGSDTATCIDACESSPLAASEIEAHAIELAARAQPTCACDLCDQEAACTATWGC